MASAVRKTVGMMSFEGVDSGRVPLVASKENPNGLPPGKCPWANNASFRDGAVQSRPGFVYLTTLPAAGLFQDAYMYEPLGGEFPYIVSQIGGRTFRTLVDVDPVVTDELTIPGDPNSAAIAQSWTQQGEEFLVIQDNNSLPLFWDGDTLRRSLGPARVLGTVSVANTVPAVGAYVLLTLTAPFAGQSGSTVYINGKTFTVSAGGDFITLKASIPTFPGSTVPGGANVVQGSSYFTPLPGGATTVVDQPFVIPISGGSVTVPVRSAWTGPVPSIVLVAGSTGLTGAGWDLTGIGLPPAGPNQVYLTNLTGTPTDPIGIGDTIESAPELPTGQAMDYYMGRLWIANGREYLAGDIVGGSSGSPQDGYRDSILKMTENAFTVSGGAFIVPSQAGNIRALKHPANLDTALGEGQLLPMTRRNIYSTNVTPTRADWALLTEPIQRVAQINFGTVSDRSVVPVNGDLFYQSIDGVRSLQQAIRYFEQWGNVPLSQEEQRVIGLNDRSLLRFATGAEFDNRLLQSALPFETPVGVAHKAIMPLNFEVLNSMASKLPPVWEGIWEGINVLKLLKGDFGGRQRCFALIWSEIHAGIELWEIATEADGLNDYGKDSTPGGDRVTWSFETPAFDWGNPFEIKELDTLEIWVDRLSGTVDFSVEFRPDQFPCWQYWTRWQECAARNECELINPLLPCDHPTQEYAPQYRSTMVLSKPPITCNGIMKRPMNIGYTFQFRITIKGQCRVRGLLAHSYPREKQAYYGLVCPAQ